MFIKSSISLNQGSLNRVSGVLVCMSMMWRLDERGHPSTKKCFRFRRLIISHPVTSLFLGGTSNHLSERLTKCQDGRGLRPHKIHFWIRLPRDLMEHVSNKCKTWLCFHVITIFFSSKFQGQEIVNRVLSLLAFSYIIIY